MMQVEYRKLYNDTVVAFDDGHVSETGQPSETKFNKQSCLRAIENVKARRESYATQEAYERRLNLFVGAARFMGWL